MNKILIIGPAWVGDMVMAQSLFKLLINKRPGCQIDVLAPDATRPLLTHMPEVRRALPLPFKHGQLEWAARYRLGRTLREESYDQAIILPNSYKSALVPFSAKIPVRTGWRGEARFGVVNDIRRLDEEALPLMIQRFCALGVPKNEILPSQLPCPRLHVAKDCVENTLKKLAIVRPDRRVLALCPGAEYGPAKRWPARYYAEVAKTKLAAGWDVWLFGGAKDREAAAEIQATTNNACKDLTGHTTLTEAVDLLSLADAVISNDSGLMHIAAALSRPLVVVYGSSDPRFTPPLSERVKILSLGLSCSPCFKRTCPLDHLKCLQDLLPTQVLTALSAVEA